MSVVQAPVVEPYRPSKSRVGRAAFTCCERHAFLLQVADAIPDHRQHVAIGGDVGRVRQPPAARNDPRAALRPVLGHRDVEDVIQAVDHALNAAALATSISG